MKAAGITIGIFLWAIIPGVMAYRRDRNPLVYYVLSLLISPLVTIIILACLGKRVFSVNKYLDENKQLNDVYTSDYSPEPEELLSSLINSVKGNVNIYMIKKLCNEKDVQYRKKISKTVFSNKSFIPDKYNSESYETKEISLKNALMFAEANKVTLYVNTTDYPITTDYTHKILKKALGDNYIQEVNKQDCIKTSKESDTIPQYCRKCGEKLNSDSDFCHKCGTEVVNE